MKRIVATMLALVMLLGTTAMAAEYTVKSGDTLAKIAKSELGDASRWQEIYEANKDTVTNPNKIFVGQKLTIPGGEDTQPGTSVEPQTPSTPTTPTTPTVPTDGTEYEADIVIVGAGGAGLLAAYTASEGGAKVIVMEKAANALGSNFSRCGGPAGAETIVAQRQGVTTTNKEVFDHLYDYANTTVDAKLLWEVWNRAGVAINEMVGLGIPFRDVNADTYGVGFLARHSFGVGGANRVGPLTNAIEANGGQFLYSTPGEHILMEDGKAVGVWGTNADGETVLVRAKAVMICTGGFQGDKEMLHERFGDVNVISLGSNNPTGDGIRMVLEAGGQLDRNFGVLGDEFKGNNTKAVGGNDNLVFWLYGGLFVDRDGDRFINEKLIADFPLALGGEAILRQGKVYAVMDDAYYTACTTDGEGIINFLGDPDDWASKVGLRAKTGLVNAPGQLQKAIDEGWAIKADTLAEAAAYFGLENLEQTVAEYNEMCANGVDPMFNKSPNFLTAIGEGPYYVFEYEPAAWSTFGGVKTDSYLRAVGAGGDVIPGLYCGGCEVGSYYAVPYFDGPGSCVGIAVGSGVWAAENMLDYIGKLADEPTYKTGNYSASVKGFGGDVTVTLTVAADKIINVFVDGADETATVGGAILGRLANQAKGQGKIDTVSGATVTSGAAQVAYAKALAKATGVTPAKAAVKDGTYEETVVGHGINGMLTMAVTIEGGKIAGIEAVGTHDETPDIFATVEDKLVSRIIENQSLAVDAIGGATASSNAVVQAVAMAIEEAGGNRADWYDAVEKKSGTVKLEGYDVIVVGLGGSGMASYISAAENGATVFGIETAAKIGGTSSNVSGPMAINPQLKMDAENEGKKFLEEEDLIEDWLEYCLGDAKEEMVRYFVYESGKTMDWLMTEYDFQFSAIRAFFHPKMWKVWGTYVGNKTSMMTNAVEKAKAMNDKNDYMLELTATDIIMEDGKVVGVKATYYDGTTYEIYGKNVILATGGFLGNAEMTQKYLGATFHAEAMTQNDGFGVLAGLKAGGALYNEDMPGMVHIANVTNVIKNDALTETEKAVLTALLLNTNAPIVGINGVSLNDTTNLPFDSWKADGAFFTLYTQEQIDELAANGMANPQATSPHGQNGRWAPNTPCDTMDKVLSVGAQFGNVFKAESVEELATKTGIPAEALAEAADGMTGTLYAIAGAGYFYGTCGGLDVDTNMNVLRPDGSPITNLYAVGQDSMGVLFSNQVAYVTYGGAAQGWVLTSGRLAGANAAANK